MTGFTFVEKTDGDTCYDWGRNCRTLGFVKDQALRFLEDAGITDADRITIFIAGYDSGPRPNKEIYVISFTQQDEISDPARIPQPNVRGTYCGDPAATHTVSTGDARFGYGIYGYYTCEMDAFRVRKFLQDNNCANLSVEPYDPTDPVRSGIHDKVAAHMAGII